MVSTIEYALMAGRAYQTTRDPINQFPVPVGLGKKKRKKKRDRLLFWRFPRAPART